MFEIETKVAWPSNTLHYNTQTDKGTIQKEENIYWKTFNIDTYL